MSNYPPLAHAGRPHRQVHRTPGFEVMEAFADCTGRDDKLRRKEGPGINPKTCFPLTGADEERCMGMDKHSSLLRDVPQNILGYAIVRPPGGGWDRFITGRGILLFSVA